MRLALGTVQFGLAYGVAGRGEAVPEPEVRSILEDAASRGVRTLDTASAYGDIEERLCRLVEGLPLGIVSKVPPVPQELSPTESADFVLRAADLSHARLGPRLRGLMLHRGTDLDGPRGEALAMALRTWCANREIRFGASCYSPAEAALLAATRGIALTQLPGNALDQRVGREPDGLIGVEVHLRSAFLQGLLLMPEERAAARLPQASQMLANWHTYCRIAGLTPLEMALSVVKSFAAVATVVVGVDSLSQWREIARAWEQARPIAAPELHCTSPQVIDPRLWNSLA
jgi:aryl-alcohol dehydrogenase-like predicted oxidoreductase